MPLIEHKVTSPKMQSGLISHLNIYIMTRAELTPIGPINVLLFTPEFMQWVYSYHDLSTTYGRFRFHQEFNEHTWTSWEEEYHSTFHLTATKPAIEQAYRNGGYGGRYIWIEMTDGSFQKLDDMDNVKSYQSTAAEGIAFAN